MNWKKQIVVDGLARIAVGPCIGSGKSITLSHIGVETGERRIVLLA